MPLEFTHDEIEIYYGITKNMPNLLDIIIQHLRQKHPTLRISAWSYQHYLDQGIPLTTGIWLSLAGTHLTINTCQPTGNNETIFTKLTTLDLNDPHSLTQLEQIVENT